MWMRHLIAIAVLLPLAGGAHACLFATSTPPQGWYQWASALFAGDVTALEKDAQKPVDVITVRVVETFKGPDASNGTLTVRVPSRNWAACKIEIPAAGARVLVAMNANSEVMLVPLSTAYAEKLRAIRGQVRN
ncbi:MAG TPA: hypothetical protein VFR83_05005 [Burkholderiales bacterium]|nr:hypothetical protein [Burkholderiales bacterium]